MTSLVLLPLAVPLGAGEFALCGLLSTITASAVRSEPIGEGNWMAIVGSDAVGPHRDLARRLSVPTAFVVFTLIGLVQELVLRAGIFALAGYETTLAVVVSVVVSPLVMIVLVRGAEARYVAGVVGAVSGCVHALLYGATHAVLPLAVADAVFYSLASL
ncbi:hypothetical protein AB0G83_23870 [Streptomyces klenkii]|uniref:hypothetical protein n=1 Tax=Streptomyces klenkii TaxID=1420899 RepID=UPI0033EF238A